VTYKLSNNNIVGVVADSWLAAQLLLRFQVPHVEFNLDGRLTQALHCSPIGVHLHVKTEQKRRLLRFQEYKYLISMEKCACDCFARIASKVVSAEEFPAKEAIFRRLEKVQLFLFFQDGNGVV